MTFLDKKDYLRDLLYDYNIEDFATLDKSKCWDTDQGSFHIQNLYYSVDEKKLELLNESPLTADFISVHISGDSSDMTYIIMLNDDIEFINGLNSNSGNGFRYRYKSIPGRNDEFITIMYSGMYHRTFWKTLTSKVRKFFQLLVNRRDYELQRH